MEWFLITGIILIIIGFAQFVIVGIFRIGEGWGRLSKSRAVNIIMSVSMIIAGIIFVFLNFSK